MEYKLKRISTAGIPEAIAKAELYRSLNEPEEAESICRDILAVEPQHQLALRLLGLALTDQFTGGASDRVRETEETFQRLSDPYERLYYAGILYERRAKAQFNAGQPPHILLPSFRTGVANLRKRKDQSAGKRRCHSSLEPCVRLLQNRTYVGCVGARTRSTRHRRRTADKNLPDE
jgi:hypothetical protein